MRDTKSAIGGYFELEITKLGSIYHDNALALNSGRNAFEYILISKGYKKIHIPYFTCDVLLQPLDRLNIEYSFYHIDNDFKPIILNYHFSDAILYTNYFGLNAKNVYDLSLIYPNIIIDNSQAFFDKEFSNLDTFYSPRKFFGVPDGGFVYCESKTIGDKYEIDISLGRMMHLLTRIELGAEAGYHLFNENDIKINNQSIKLMSKLTRALLNGIDYEQVLKTRLQNFAYIHEKLKQSNRLTAFIDNAKITCPMIYPYWVENGARLRKNLAKNRVYTAMYWPNVLKWVDIDKLEYDFATNIVYLSIDQRCNIQSIEQILNVIISKK
jgi:hypothetical protein